jgi:hypothetical protein
VRPVPEEQFGEAVDEFCNKFQLDAGDKVEKTRWMVWRL